MSRDALSGPELQHLTRALLAAFDRDGLERLVSFYLDQDLAVIADAGNLQDTAFELIRWTIRHGELTTLVEAAFVENPKNPELVKFRRDVWDAAPAIVTISASEAARADPRVQSSALPVATGSPSDHEAVGPISGTPGDPWTMNRRVVLPVAAGLAGLGVVYVLINRPGNGVPPPVTPEDGSGPQPTTESPGPSVTQVPPPPTPTIIPDTASVRFGNVGSPAFTDRLIPDSQNAAWDGDLGRRNVKGVVYHRTQGDIWATDAWLRLVPPGGAEQCAAVSDRTSFGGCNGLFDFGVDGVSGEILRWNDPYGEGYEDQDVSPNRSGWANGPVQDPFGEAAAFIAQNDVVAVNRDQASIQIGGNFDDPISDACKETVAALSAYFADQLNIRWNAYPTIPGENYGFVRWHNQFYPFRECPGPVVTAATNEIIERTRDILREFQTG